jgi:hypothetical protein
MTRQELGEKYRHILRTPFLFECGDGWFDIVDKALMAMDPILREGEIKILQIKEKYGGLRIYTTFTNDALDAIVARAEDEAKKTCEICGREGKMTCTHRWYRTLCPNCEQSS